MNVVLQNPFGLLGLLSLPLIVWLHRYVVSGERRLVSCLALWDDAQAGAEGATARRPPLTLVLFLELLAATAATLALAGIEVRHGAGGAPVLNIVVDTSASMAGGRGGDSPWERTLQHLEDLKRRRPATRWRIVLSAAVPELIGGTALGAEDALARLRERRPLAAHHDLQPALDLLALLAATSDSTLVFSDESEAQHPRLVRVGRAETNVGFVAAGWTDAGGPFAVLRGFGEPMAVDVAIARDGVRERRRVDLDGDTEVVLRIPVDSAARRVDLWLPEDALAADNRVALLRPLERSVTMSVQHPDAKLGAALSRVTSALPELTLVERLPADIVVSDRPLEGAGFVNIVIGDAAGEHVLFRGLRADPFSPLLEGLDPSGLVWNAAAAVSPPAARTLLSAGAVPLVWSEEGRLAVNLDLRRSNLLRHDALPILFANIVRAADAAQPGLPRNHFRVGEELSLRPERAGEEVELRAPDGRTRTFAAGEAIAANLDSAGLYRLRMGGRETELAVNFLDAHESDLRARPEPGSLPQLHGAETHGTSGSAALRQALVMATIALLCAAWTLLVPRRRGA